ncbi:hypothetical protein AG1IA_06338 [Rhizoctonia solani AG-1 IA]|uniref:Uncharacterized protein n=1 Tax=Thanatephorus cucumeris (strain AG1-IA) TaxID=983506 RepID=L8WNR5_THACA|nr:hypothetical protein AG1IA_06338 [Rhizoctonia solani AG-1 IA]
MDPKAGMTVSLGTIGVSCTGALSGAVYALFKSQSPALMGFAAGINSGIAGLTFFALREYVVSPALVLSLDTSQYAQRRARLGITSKQFNDLKYAHEHQDELAMIRRDRLLDTGVAGAIAGGGLNFCIGARRCTDYCSGRADGRLGMHFGAGGGQRIGGSEDPICCGDSDDCTCSFDSIYTSGF